MPAYADGNIRIDATLLDSPFKQTFVTSVLDAPHVNKDARERGEWIGTASIIGPSDMSPSVLALFREVGVGGNWEMYGMYAMWVHPAHWGKGIGAQMVKACSESARTNVDIKFSSQNSGGFEKVVVLLVYDNNVAWRAQNRIQIFTDLHRRGKGGMFQSPPTIDLLVLFKKHLEDTLVRALREHPLVYGSLHRFSFAQLPLCDERS